MAPTTARITSLLTIAAAAARLGCSDMHVYRLIAAGELAAVDIAQPGARRSKTRVRSDDVDVYIDAKTRGVRAADHRGVTRMADGSDGASVAAS
jgi:excisionase family DNA binding protein